MACFAQLLPMVLFYLVELCLGLIIVDTFTNIFSRHKNILTNVLYSHAAWQVRNRGALSQW